VAGINTAIIAMAQGIGFAIPRRRAVGADGDPHQGRVRRPGSVWGRATGRWI